MFQSDPGHAGGFMTGSTEIPPMSNPPSASTANGGSNTADGLQNLALASSTSYYSDYNPAQQYSQLDSNGTQGGEGAIAYAQTPRAPSAGTGLAGPGGDHSGNESQAEGSASGLPGAQPVLHRVRKNDRNRICTSCGTTNSPEWRKGPSGIKTLCNACGLRYSRAQARKAKRAQKEADAEAARLARAAMIANGEDPAHLEQQVMVPQSYGAGGGPGVPAPLQLNGIGVGSTSGSMVHGGGGGGSENHTPNSPYLNVGVGDYGQGDYSQGAYGVGVSATTGLDVGSALPPLPLSAASHHSSHHEEQGHLGGGNQGDDTQVPSAAQTNYSYGTFHGFTPYGEWSPASNGSFAQQQNGGGVQ